MGTRVSLRPRTSGGCPSGTGAGPGGEAGPARSTTDRRTESTVTDSEYTRPRLSDPSAVVPDAAAAAAPAEAADAGDAACAAGTAAAAGQAPSGTGHEPWAWPWPEDPEPEDPDGAGD